jgi:ribose-phosphate pyrophosphokinase
MSIELYTRYTERQLRADFSTWSGGEEHVTLDDEEIRQSGDLLISAAIKSSADVMRLLLLNDAIRRTGFSGQMVLEMPYVPYGRQDRQCNPGESFSLKVFTSLINSCGFAEVNTWDSHSYVTNALLDRSADFSVVEILAKFALEDYDFNHILADKSLTLVSPDAGSLKKVLAAGQHFQLPVIRADKQRDPLTGEVFGAVIHDDRMVDNVMIIDDICDGGRTFMQLAIALKPIVRGNIFLYVTHGIFSRGTRSIFESGIDKIFCANNMMTLERFTGVCPVITAESIPV